MHLKQKIKLILLNIVELPIWVKILTIIVLLLSTVHLIALIQNRSVNFTYDTKTTCIQQLTLLPGLVRPTDSEADFSITKEDIIQIGGIQIFSSKTCFLAKKSPSVGKTMVSVAFFGGWFAKETLEINVPPPPNLNFEVLSQLIPTIKPLEIPLDGSDLVFDYRIIIDNRSVLCFMKNKMLNCDIVPLNLLQSTDYHFELIRGFNNKDESTLIKKDVRTIDAAAVINASVTQDQIIYDNPTTFTFEFNKIITKGDIILEQIGIDSRILVPIVVIFNSNMATITLANDLGREMAYEFTIGNIHAQDSSTLDALYKISFKTSGGPIVIDISSGLVGMPLTQTIVLTFDQVLSDDQNINNFVNTIGFPTAISKSNNQVFIKYANAPICTNLNINISPGIKSNYGIIQDNSQAFSMRTFCHSVNVIGYSVLGRPILAYTFGSGSTSILFTGGIHGSEPSGSRILYDWINYLEINASSIPANKKIVVVPEVNPDGLAGLSRYNANNVNIDRNFPSANWAANIETGNGVMVNGGGSSAMSEPETRALANITLGLMPSLEVSFHAQGRLVGANQYGNSVAIANLYISSVGYRSMIGQAEATMGYSITGEYEDWAGEHGIPAILIELPSASGYYFSAHQYILWQIVNL